MVSAPATYWTSVQARSASCKASTAAARPYSTKLRPHLPHGCIPAPNTATRLGSGIGPPPSDRRRSGSPLPHQVLVFVVLVQGVEHELHLASDGQLVHPDPRHDLAHHHHPFGAELDGGDGEGDVGS